MTSEVQTAGDALRLVQTVLRAYADGDQDAVLWALNTADEPVARWALSYALSAVVELVSDKHDHKAARVARALRGHADGIDRDIIDNQMTLIVNDDEQGDHDG